MGKFKCSSKASRACRSIRNAGHCKTRVSVGSHVKVTVGTKGIHTSIKAGPVTYKPGSGNYSVKTPINNVKYYGNVGNNHSSYSDYDELDYCDFRTEYYNDENSNCMAKPIILIVVFIFCIIFAL